MRDVVLVLCRHVYDRELITGLLSVWLKYCQGHGTCCLKSLVAHVDRESRQYQRGGARAVLVDPPKNKQNYVDALESWAALEGQELVGRRVCTHVDNGHGDLDGSQTLGRGMCGAEQAQLNGFAPHGSRCS